MGGSVVNKPFKWIWELEPVVRIKWSKSETMQGLGYNAEDHLQGTRRVPMSKAKELRQVREGIILQ